MHLVRRSSTPLIIPDRSNYNPLFDSCGLTRPEKEISWWRWCVSVCSNGGERCLGGRAAAKRHSGGLSFPI